MPRKYLVIVRAGDSSLHPQWLEGTSNRSWDLVVNYFGNDPDLYRVDDVVRIDSKGPKWPALHDVILANPRFMTDYSHIWLPDDDLRADLDSINSLFAICEESALEVAQPALTWDSYFGHLTTLQSVNYRMRFTNYVEVMAPCLSMDMLKRSVGLFNSNLSGWGLDFIWARLARDPDSGIAIIDRVTVKHTRPVGGPNYEALRKGGVSPWDELRQFCITNGIDEAPLIATHKAIRRDGTVVRARGQGRWFALGFVAGYIPAVRCTPDPRRMLRRIAGMAFKALCNVPDRVSEVPLTKQAWRSWMAVRPRP